MDHKTISDTDQRILAARSSLASRLSAVEDRVTGTIENARTAVEDSTATVRDAIADVSGGVKGLMSSATDNLSTALDFRQKVREHPLQGTLIAVGAGLAAWLLTRPRDPRPASSVSAGSMKSFAVSEPSGPFGEIYDAFRRELVSVGQTAAASASKILKENVQNLTAMAAPANHGNAAHSRSGYDSVN